jgi:hypothetical protein
VIASLLVTSARADSCAEATSARQIEELLDQAERAFTELHIETFIARTDEVRDRLPCLEEVPSQTLVARLHRNEGLRLFGERNVDSVRAFAAARSLEPDFRFPADMVPADSPILADWSAMDLAAGWSVLLPEPEEGTVFVDGTASRVLPRAWPALVQLVDGSDAPQLSVYLRYSDQPPDYGVRNSKRMAKRLPLLIVTGATALTAAAAYGGAWRTRSIWNDPETDEARLPTLRSRTNALTGTSVAVGLLSVASGTLLVLTW